MKKLKKFEWKDNVTELGKEMGLFEVIAKNDILSFYYSITNRNDGNHTDRFYLYIENYSNETDSGSIEFDDLESAKEYAQQDFEKQIMNLFFE